MKRKQNVIIFSAGESVRNGNVGYIEEKLSQKGILCYDWRSLFSHAHDSDKIALLPALSKKIPTFDFALIIAEGVDTVKLRGSEVHSAIRDNVIFELGLCIMALGVERVILLAEESVRIPEDLIGVGKIGIEYVTFTSEEKSDSVNKLGEIIERKTDEFSDKFSSQLDEIIAHIDTNSKVVSPVFVGAAVSSAEAYYLNFVVRLLENADKGFSEKGNSTTIYKFSDDLKIRILVPMSVGTLTRSAISAFYAENGYKEYVIADAGIRGLFFNAAFNEKTKSLTVADIPTSITASYIIVNSVLNINSDDDYDSLAEERFITKEMDVYAMALKKLLSSDIAERRLSFIRDENKKQKVLRLLKNVSVEFVDLRL